MGPGSAWTSASSFASWSTSTVPSSNVRRSGGSEVPVHSVLGPTGGAATAADRPSPRRMQPRPPPRPQAAAIASASRLSLPTEPIVGRLPTRCLTPDSSGHTTGLVSSEVVQLPTTATRRHLTDRQALTVHRLTEAAVEELVEA